VDQFRAWTRKKTVSTLSAQSLPPRLTSYGAVPARGTVGLAEGTDTTVLICVLWVSTHVPNRYTPVSQSYPPCSESSWNLQLGS